MNFQFLASRRAVLYLVTLAVMVINSCVNPDEYDFKRVQALKWNPSLAVPLVNTTLDIKDLLNKADSSYIRTYKDAANSGLIYLYYEDSLLSYDLLDLFNLPNQTISKQLSLPQISYQT
jgi:hypothetical protein